MNNDTKNNCKTVDSLLYLNKQRIALLASSEFVLGQKLAKYINLLKKFRFIQIVKEFAHDIFALVFKKNSHHSIINFEENRITKDGLKIIVYTCIYGNYDSILEPLIVDPNCDYYIFTDQVISEESVWKKADDSIIPKECNTPALKNRYVKMFPYKFFDCDYSLYIDGNLQVVGFPSHLVQQSIQTCKTGMALHLAPREKCIYEEARTVYHFGKISKKERNKMLKFYKENKMPRNYGMFECNVIVRNHDNLNMKKIMTEWWEHYKNGVKRDQLYFTFVLYKLGYEFSDVINFGASVNRNPHFLRNNHK